MDNTMSNQCYLSEQREEKRRLAALRRGHEERAAKAMIGDRDKITGHALQRRQALVGRVVAASAAPRRSYLPDSRWLGWAGGAAALALLLAWNIRWWRGPGPDSEAERYRPVAVAEPLTAPAAMYAKTLLATCRRQGFGALQGQWADGLPGYLRDISAKSIAPYLAAPNQPLHIAAVEQRRNSVFVRCAAGEEVHFTLHLRESAPGRYTLVAIE
jgi:hypothetical protein